VAAWLTWATALLPAAGWAGDGVVELNQVCATETGCTPTDAPGFPITLDTRGSYRLTSQLAVLPSTADGIEISSDDITIDFNGFSMIGAREILGLVCPFPGAGVRATGAAAGFVVQNGNVRGMGTAGIDVNAANVRIDRMTVSGNCGLGMKIGVAGLVIESLARANLGDGVIVGLGSRVRDSVADSNSGTGIFLGSGSAVTGCVARANTAEGIRMYDGFGATGGVLVGNAVVGNGGVSLANGIELPDGAVATDNSVSANSGTGLTAGSSTGVGDNAAAGNSGAEFFGGVRMGCNSVDGVVFCP
jgi:hypothetical protein